MLHLCASITCRRGLLSEENDRQVGGDVMALSRNVLDSVAPVQKVSAFLRDVNVVRLVQVRK